MKIPLYDFTEKKHQEVQFEILALLNKIQEITHNFIELLYGFDKRLKEIEKPEQK